MYVVALLPGARRDLAQLDAVPRARILTAITELASNPQPHDSKKLIGRGDDWRIRVGDFRVLYETRAQDMRLAPRS